MFTISEYENVMKYELTRTQKKKIWSLIVRQNFRNCVEVFIDLLIDREKYRMKDLIKKNDPMTKDWYIERFS